MHRGCIQALLTSILVTAKEASVFGKSRMNQFNFFSVRVRSNENVWKVKKWNPPKSRFASCRDMQFYAGSPSGTEKVTFLRHSISPLFDWGICVFCHFEIVIGGGFPGDTMTSNSLNRLLLPVQIDFSGNSMKIQWMLGKSIWTSNNVWFGEWDFRCRNGMEWFFWKSPSLSFEQGIPCSNERPGEIDSISFHFSLSVPPRCKKIQKASRRRDLSFEQGIPCSNERSGEVDPTISLFCKKD